MKRKINWGYLWLLPFAVIVVVCILSLTGVIVGGVSNSYWSGWLSKDLTKQDNFTLVVTTTEGLTTTVKVDQQKQIMVIEKQSTEQSTTVLEASTSDTGVKTDTTYYFNSQYALLEVKVVKLEDKLVEFTPKQVRLQEVEQQFGSATALWEVINEFATAEVKSQFTFQPSTDIYTYSQSDMECSIQFTRHGVKTNIKYADNTVLNIELKDCNNTQIAVPYEVRNYF